jgi:AAA+ ATPase superfamily predicted ATPase
MEIIGRKAEQADLQLYYESQHPEFLAVYGRRRVGKTFLIKEFFKNDFTFYTTGLAKASRAEQLEAFTTALKAYGHRTAAPRNWLEAFVSLRDLLEQSNRVGKKVIFIDEMPWFDTPRSGFLTGLEHFWNSWASSQPNVLLIVCGSVSSWMINKLLKNHGGLYGRVTQRMNLMPFDLGTCEQFFLKNGIIFSRYQILEYYMVFGGIPHYLGMVRKGLSIAQNIDRLCFEQSAPLRYEFDDMLSSIFRKPENHKLIIAALSRKTKGLARDEIVKETGIPNNGHLSEALEELEQSGFLRRYHGFGKTRKASLYQLVDFFCNFHFRYLAGLGREVEGQWTVFSASPAHNAWSGYAFEQVCLAHISQIKRKLGISGVLSPVCSWRSERKQSGKASREPGAQVDLVIDRNDGIINLCEAKYAQEEFAIDAACDAEFRQRKAAFVRETKTRKAVHTTMVTTYGIVHNAYWNNIQSEVTADDLFE